MTAGRSDSRVVHCIAVAIVLGTVYLGYSALLSPLLDVERRQQQFTRAVTVASTGSEAQDMAQRWFPAEPWVAECGNHFHDGDRYLYYRTNEISEDNLTLSAHPIALLWQNPDSADETPVTLVADEARLETSEPLSFQSGSVGRIVGGVLDGRVQVRGPRNLRIDGRRFSISEDSLTLSSSQPVKFEWEDHAGEASSGVDIVMHAPQQEDAGGLLSVSDIREIRLNGRVTCRMLFRAKRANEQDLRMQITAADGFKFDVDYGTGTFYGVHKRSRNRSFRLDEQVVVKRLTSDGQEDQLVCSQLKMVFGPDVSLTTGQPDPSRLRLEHVVAEGEEVVFYSEAQGVTARMTELAYLVNERRISMRNTNRNADDRPLPVEINQQGSKLLVSELQLLHAVDGHLQRLECRGPGIIRHQEAVDAAVMAAHWRQGLVIQESADQTQRIVTLSGDAAVEQAQQSFALTAQTIVMKLRSLIDPETAETETSGLPAIQQDPLSLRSLQPEVLTASGGVSLSSPDVSGTVRDQLTVNFDPSVMLMSSTDDADETDLNNPLAAIGSSKQLSDEPAKPAAAAVTFASDTLKATVRQGTGADSNRLQLSNVWLTGQVALQRDDPDPAKALTAAGNALEAVQGLQDSRQITLFGDPATIVTGMRRLEGKRIDLEDLPGALAVNGSGRLRVVTDKGFDGKPLPRPTPLDIYWNESMSFRGREASFVGNIRVVMKDGQTQDLELTCAGLKVFFDRDLGLSQSPESREFEVAGSDQDPIQVARIVCESIVSIRLDQLQDGTVQARHRARVADLVVNAETGDFQALGPGWISSTTPDSEGPLHSTPSASVRANAPARISDTAFVFVKASFIGDLTGNLQQQNATLAQHVRGVFAPVRDIGEQISVDTVPTDELPENVGIIRAERLIAAAIPATTDQPASFSLTASENARIESRPFSGNADVITYDHSKQQFILRAEDNRIANVRYRPGRSGHYNTIHGKRFEYYRATNHLAFNSISGLTATE